MRVVSVCMGLVVVCGLGCGGRGIDKVLADLPTQGQGGGSTGEGTVGGMAGAGMAGAGVPNAGTGGAGGATTVATGGAEQGGQPGVGGHPNGCCYSPRPTGGAPGTGMAGATGTGTGGAAGSGGVAGGPTTCDSFSVGSTLTLAPAAPGQAYARCGTLGPEQGWTVTPSPTGDRLAAITAAGTVRLISTTTWTEVAQLASPVGELDAVAFSPDGTRLATLSSEMGEVTLWRASDGALQTSFAGPPASTLDTIASWLAFSPDGLKLATSLGTVIDLTTGARTNWRTGAPDTTALQPEPREPERLRRRRLPAAPVHGGRRQAVRRHAVPDRQLAAQHSAGAAGPDDGRTDRPLRRVRASAARVRHLRRRPVHRARRDRGGRRRRRLRSGAVRHRRDDRARRSPVIRRRRRRRCSASRTMARGCSRRPAATS